MERLGGIPNGGGCLTHWIVWGVIVPAAFVVIGLMAFVIYLFVELAANRWRTDDDDGHMEHDKDRFRRLNVRDRRAKK